MTNTILKKFNWKETKIELPFKEAKFKLIDLEGGGVIPELVYIQDDEGSEYEIGFFHLSNEGFEKYILGSFKNKITTFSGIRLSKLIQEELLTIDKENNISLYEFDNISKKLILLKQINSDSVRFALKIKTFYFNQQSYALIIGEKITVFKITKEQNDNCEINLVYDSSQIPHLNLPMNLEDGYPIFIQDEFNFEILLCSDKGVCILEVKNGNSCMKCNLLPSNSYIEETYCYIPEDSFPSALVICKTLTNVLYFKYDGKNLTKKILDINQDLFDSITHHESLTKEPTPLVIGDFKNIGKISLVKNLLSEFENPEVISLDEIQVDSEFKLNPIAILSHQYSELGITYIIVIFQQEKKDFLDNISSIMINPFYVQTNFEIFDDNTLNKNIELANKKIDEIDLYFTHALDCFYHYENEFEIEQINLEAIMDSIDIIDLIIPRTEISDTTKNKLIMLRKRYDNFSNNINKKHQINFGFNKLQLQIEKPKQNEIILENLNTKIYNSKDKNKNLVVNSPLRLSFILQNSSSIDIFDIRLNYKEVESILQEKKVTLYIGCKEENLIDILKSKKSIKYSLFLETENSLNSNIKIPITYSVIIDDKIVDKALELIIPDFECSTLIQVSNPIIINQSRGHFVVQDNILERDLVYYYQIKITPITKTKIISCILNLDKNIVPNDLGFKTLQNREISPNNKEITDYISFTPKKIGKAKIGPLIVKTTDGSFKIKEISIEIKEKEPFFQINDIELIQNKALKGKKPHLGIPFLINIIISKNDVEIEGVKPYIKPLTRNLKVLEAPDILNFSNKTIINQTFKLVPVFDSNRLDEKASIQASFIHGNKSDTKIFEFNIDLSEPKIIAYCSMKEPYPIIRDINDSLNLDFHIQIENGCLKESILYFKNNYSDDLIIYPNDISLGNLSSLENPTYTQSIKINTKKKITKVIELDLNLSYHNYYDDEIENRTDEDRKIHHVKSIPIYIDTITKKRTNNDLENIKNKLQKFLSLKCKEYKESLKNNQPFLPFVFNNSNLPDTIDDFSMMTIIPILQNMNKIIISDNNNKNYFIGEHIDYMIESFINAGINVFTTQYNCLDDISQEIIIRYLWNFINQFIKRSYELIDV